jgi:putative endonuclease
VKARGGETEALESVTAEKRRRIARGAEAFIAAHPRYAQHDLRFDAMVVTSPWKISHFRDAWRLE